MSDLKFEGQGPHTVPWSVKYSGGPVNDTIYSTLYVPKFGPDPFFRNGTSSTVSGASGTLSGTFTINNSKDNELEGGLSDKEKFGTISSFYVHLYWGGTVFPNTSDSPEFKIAKDPPKKKTTGQGVVGYYRGTTSYNAASRLLTFAGTTFNQSGTFAGTSYPSDPIVGAAISVPTLQYAGEVLPGEHLFTNPAERGATQFTITKGGNTFLSGSLDGFAYYPADNAFQWIFSDLKLAGASPTSPYYDASMPGLGSPFTTGFDQAMAASGDAWTASWVLPFLAMTPDTDVLAATSGFTTSGSWNYNASSGTYFAMVPEPSGTCIVSLGAVLFVINHWLRRKRVSPHY